jgi:hypothetical protein
VAAVRKSSVIVAPPRTSGAPTGDVHVSVVAVSRPRVWRSPHVVGRPQLKRRVVVAEALAADPRVPGDVPVMALMAAAVAALLALAAIWTQVRTRSER